MPPKKSPVGPAANDDSEDSAPLAEETGRLRALFQRAPCSPVFSRVFFLSKYSSLFFFFLTTAVYDFYSHFTASPERTILDVIHL